MTPGLGKVERPAKMNEPFIAVRSLSKVFGKRPGLALAPENADKSKEQLLAELGCVLALKEINFTVNRSETFVVMGLSGSGKSTLVRCLIRLIEPTNGEILIEGENILNYDETALVEFRRSKVAMVFQGYGLLPHRRVLDNVAWGLEIQGIGKPARYARTREILELVGLQEWEQAYPRELSGGMQQRVGLARALAVDPDILLLDEPFSGLDPLIRRNMQDELLRLQQELHKTIIFITHDLNEAVKIGDRIAIMRDGRIIQIGSPQDIILHPEDEYVGEFTQDVRRESILCASVVMTEPSAVIQDGDPPSQALGAMKRGDSPAALVVDASGKYLGLLTREAAEKAQRIGMEGVGQSLDYLDRRVMGVTVQTPCEVLIPLVMASDLPIPVVDDEGNLVGQVERRTIAAAMTQPSQTHLPG